MPTTILSGKRKGGLVEFSQVGKSLVFIADGVSETQRWNGFGAARRAGVKAPSTAAVAAVQAVSGGAVSAGGYNVYYRFVDADGNVGNLSPASNTVTVPSSAGQKIVLTGLQTAAAAGEPNAVKRQILRNTAGQFLVYYIETEINTTDATVQLGDADSALQVKEPVTVFDSTGKALANVNGLPPTYHRLFAAHLGRVFSAGEVDLDEGHVAVVNGSSSVRFTGAQIVADVAGRDLWIAGADKAYSISSVDVAAQTASLSSAYAGATDPFAKYAVRVKPALQRTVRYSEPGKPESWPTANSISLQETNDRVTALVSNGSFLYVFERNHIHKITFGSDPATDGAIWLQAYRGVVNARSLVIVDGVIYALDSRGVHAYQGGSDSQQISSPIQGLFRDDSDSPWRIHWQSADWFHAAYSPGEETIRWFVSLAGSRYPRHALAFHLGRQRWWIEEYPVPIASSSLAQTRQAAVFAGGSAGEVFALSVGRVDVARPRGTLRGNVESAGPCDIVDSDGVWNSDMIGAPVYIVDGTGRGQANEIVEISGSRLVCRNLWTVRPDATSTYQIGGIPWEYRSGWFAWGQSEDDDSRSLWIFFDPLGSPGSLVAKVYENFSEDAATYGVTRKLDGVQITKGSPDVRIDLEQSAGYAMHRLSGHSDYHARGKKVVSVGLEGVAPNGAVRIREVDLDGAEIEL